MTPERLREMEEIEKKALEGPWQLNDPINRHESSVVCPDGCTDADRLFVAAARTFVPEAIAEIRRLQKRVDRLLYRAKSDAFCPCCQETEICDPECTFATDCPDDLDRMVLARAELEGGKG